MSSIDRQAIHDTVIARHPDNDDTQYSVGYADAINDVLKDIRYMPSAESEIIRCEDCKWWDQKFDGSPMGYCMAAKHNYHSSHWEINIQRTYRKNFFCADAEPKEEGEEE